MVQMFIDKQEKLTKMITLLDVSASRIPEALDWGSRHTRATLPIQGEPRSKAFSISGSRLRHVVSESEWTAPHETPEKSHTRLFPRSVVIATCTSSRANGGNPNPTMTEYHLLEDAGESGHGVVNSTLGRAMPKGIDYVRSASLLRNNPERRGMGRK
jgi:hypothetical protein